MVFNPAIYNQQFFQSAFSTQHSAFHGSHIVPLVVHPEIERFAGEMDIVRRDLVTEQPAGGTVMRVRDDESPGKRITDRGKLVEVWRKQADGSWKCIVDTWNSDLAPAAAAAPAA